MRRSQRNGRWLSACGALFAAGAVALGAYAAHAATPATQAPLQMAAAVAFGHGVALAALAPRAAGGIARLSLVALCVGVLLFAGSVAAHALAGLSPRLAPAGGLCLIGGWLLWALSALTARGER